MIIMRPFRSTEELESLRTQAKNDAHDLLFPSHIFLKDGKPFGYVGIAPSTWYWFDRQTVGKDYQSRDVLKAAQLTENFLTNTGHRGLVLPVTDQSELLPFISRLGYGTLGKLNTFIKGL